MATDKKSFILYADIMHTVSQLPDDKAGELFKHILLYVNDKDPQTDDLFLKILFEPIKQQFKRDLVKWENTRVKRSDAGKASAESKKQNQQNQQMLTSVDFVEQTSTKSTVNVNDNVNVNVSVNVKNKKDILTTSVVYSQCVDFWLKELHQGWTFSATQGKSLKSILEKIRKVANRELSDFELISMFKRFCANLPEWYKDKDLQTLNGKFNEIVSQLEKPNHEESKYRKK